MLALLNKHTVTIFFIVTFTVTWGLCSILLVTTKPDALQNITPGFIIIGLLSGLSPSITATVLAALQDETKNLWKQLRAGVFWPFIIFTLFLVPITTFISYLSVQKFNPHLRPSDLVLGCVWPLFSSFGEEFGWRGFALPRLLKQKGFLGASLIIGLIWGIWHLPMDYIGLRSHGWLFVPEFILVGPAILTAHSIIMTYIYVRSKRNLLLMILYHYTITAGAIILPGFFTQSTISGTTILVQPLIANLFLWIPALFIIIRHKKLDYIFQLKE